MNWLAAAVKGFFAALFDWGQGQAEKPKATKHANTPKNVRDSLSESRDAWLRDRQRNGD